ncbi:ribosome silencing factor [Myxococcota bacterium]|nr:ribosome silencing factor [Myxococcota bacterium]MBU1382861.1 ribosome silencing factor [Myxococcota bacterium]MBU1496651.1 ribosome silencing factor [Myxococcota bacterium]
MELPQDVLKAFEAAQSKKATDIAVYHVGNHSGYTDYILVATGSSSRQVIAIADEIEKTLIDLKVKVIGCEGRRGGEWILTDFGFIISHVMLPETRQYYQIDNIWHQEPILRSNGD